MTLFLAQYSSEKHAELVLRLKLLFLHEKKLFFARNPLELIECLHSDQRATLPRTSQQLKCFFRTIKNATLHCR